MLPCPEGARPPSRYRAAVRCCGVLLLFVTVTAPVSLLLCKERGFRRPASCRCCRRVACEHLGGVRSGSGAAADGRYRPI